MFQMMCTHCKKVEQLAIKLLTMKCKRRRDHGNEYFEGCPSRMIYYILIAISKVESPDLHTPLSADMVSDAIPDLVYMK